jgi:hypothetical protein
MTYSPTDRLHRRFRFLRVPQYSLFLTQVPRLLRFLFTGSVDKATTKTAGSGVYSPRLGYSELKILYNDLNPCYIKIVCQICQQGLGFPTDADSIVYSAGLPAELVKILNLKYYIAIKIAD